MQYDLKKKNRSLAPEKHTILPTLNPFWTTFAVYANARKNIYPLEHSIFRITAKMQRHIIINQTQPHQGRWCTRKHCRFCHAVTGPATPSLLPYCMSINLARKIARRTQSAYNHRSVASDPGFAFRPSHLVWLQTQRRNLMDC